MDLYVGIDSSTQSLKLTIFRPDPGEIIYTDAVHFDAELPEFGTANGVVPGDRPGEVLVPPLLSLAALDLILTRVHARAPELLTHVRGIGVSAQQHMTVPLTRQAGNTVRGMRPEKSLAAHITPILARPLSPNWQDTSTEDEVRSLREELGGTSRLAAITGSDAAHRFAAAQLRKLATNDPETYARTAHVHLLSSFLASVLAGTLGPIDYSDGFGMNLACITKKTWHPEIVRIVAPDLMHRLPSLVPPMTVIGRTCRYFSERYGIPAEAIVVSGLGDNPASYLGAGMFEPADTLISLGTSDTIMASFPGCTPSEEGYGHIFGCHHGPDARLLLACLRNGALARDRVRIAAGCATWNEFTDAARTATTRENRGFILPWFEPEITPVAEAGVQYVDVSESDPAGLCAAILLGQSLALKSCARRFKLSPRRLVVTGGGSRNDVFCQTIADVFGTPVSRSAVTDSAPLGAALAAAYAAISKRSGEPHWQRCFGSFAFVDPARTFLPDQRAPVWADRIERDYLTIESRVMTKRHHTAE